MTAQAVEWVLVVFYGPSAHQSTYGRRVKKGGYTKDFIQLSRKKKFLDEVTNIFSVTGSATEVVPIAYQWPKGMAPGEFVFRSADRPHLKWRTSQGAPTAWKMVPSPSDETPETIPGDSLHQNFEDAENEFAQIANRGAGQPYLMAVKLRDEPRTLHLRAYLKNPNRDFAWADLSLVPLEIQTLAGETSQSSALASSLFQGDGIVPSAEIQDALSKLAAAQDKMTVIDPLDFDTGRALISYLRRPGHGLFFDPTQNHDAWVQPAPLPTQIAVSIDEFLQMLEIRFPANSQGDAAAETFEIDPDEVEAFREQIVHKSYEVADSTATIKTRGSAQRVFAGEVKANYEYRCAITGVTTKDFLVAAHIVPWSEDASIRLDPSNGICLSSLVDCAFEKGYLQIEDDGTIRIDWGRVGMTRRSKANLSRTTGES